MDFLAAKKQMQELREKLNKECERFFNDSAKALFNEYPQLEIFSWVEYTDYWNDGEPCNFHVHIDSAEINGFSCYESGPETKTVISCPTCKKEFGEKAQAKFCPNDGAKLEIHEESYLPKNFKKMSEDVRKFIGMFETEDYRRLFGDHCKVEVSRSGIKVSEYDHE